MKKRKNIKTYGIYAIFGLAAISLVSVGFASWVINGTTAINQAVSFAIGDISDATLTAAISGTPDGAIRFDALSSSECSSDSPISNGSTTEVEDMELSVTYTITSGTSYTTQTSYVKYSYSSALTTALAKLDGYINYSTITNTTSVTLDGTATTSDTANPKISYDTDKKVATVTQKWTFTWGTKFNSKNPCLNTTAENSDVVNDLKAFKTLYDANFATQTDFKITITPSLNN